MQPKAMSQPPRRSKRESRKATTYQPGSDADEKRGMNQPDLASKDPDQVVGNIAWGNLKKKGWTYKLDIDVCHFYGKGVSFHCAEEGLTKFTGTCALGLKVLEDGEVDKESYRTAIHKEAAAESYGRAIHKRAVAACSAKAAAPKTERKRAQGLTRNRSRENKHEAGAAAPVVAALAIGKANTDREPATKKRVGNMSLNARLAKKPLRPVPVIQNDHSTATTAITKGLGTETGSTNGKGEGASEPKQTSLNLDVIVVDEVAIKQEDGEEEVDAKSVQEIFDWLYLSTRQMREHKVREYAYALVHQLGMDSVFLLKKFLCPPGTLLKKGGGEPLVPKVHKLYMNDQMKEARLEKFQRS